MMIITLGMFIFLEPKKKLSFWTKQETHLLEALAGRNTFCVGWRLGNAFCADWLKHLYFLKLLCLKSLLT